MTKMENEMEINENTAVERELNSIMEATLRLENELFNALSAIRAK